MRYLPGFVIASLGLALCGTAGAETVTHEFTCGNCQPGTVKVIVDRPGVVHNEFPIVIDHAMTATEKRNWIADHLPFVVERVGDNKFRLFSEGDETNVAFDTGDTEESDKLTSTGADSGAIAFSGFFDPFETPGQPAIFTAGIVTDVGELTAQISAQELNFQTDGPIICQALFTRLAPTAPQYGAQINYAGDRLEVYFDPAYTVTLGGVVFGTTSPSPGCSGSTHVPDTRPCLGDLDGDGVVGLSDLAQLLANYGATSGSVYEDGDLDGDGDVDLSDLAALLAVYGTTCP